MLASSEPNPADKKITKVEDLFASLDLVNPLSGKPVEFKSHDLEIVLRHVFYRYSDLFNKVFPIDEKTGDISLSSSELTRRIDEIHRLVHEGVKNSIIDWNHFELDGQDVAPDMLRFIVHHQIVKALEKVLDSAEVIQDGLTGLWNKNFFRGVFKQELMESERLVFKGQPEKPLSMIFIDIDHFKDVNDTYGHLAGDEVLRVVAGILKKCVRETDVIGRFGGEEMTILCINSEHIGALNILRRIHEALKEPIPVTNKNGEKINVTVNISAGITDVRDIKGKTIDERIDNVINDSDYNMYILKGKNPDKNGVERDRRGGVAFRNEVIVL